MGLIMTAAIVVGLPALLLGLLRISWLELSRVDWPAPLPSRLWRIGVVGVLCILVLMALNAGPREASFFFVLAALVLLAVFLWTWQQEFVFLMSRRDDEFPGQFDRLIWAFLLIAMAPVGVWFFRSYRLAHWPEPKVETIHGRRAADLS